METRYNRRGGRILSFILAFVLAMTSLPVSMAYAADPVVSVEISDDPDAGSDNDNYQMEAYVGGGEYTLTITGLTDGESYTLTVKNGTGATLAAKAYNLEMEGATIKTLGGRNPSSKTATFTAGDDPATATITLADKLAADSYVNISVGDYAGTINIIERPESALVFSANTDKTISAESTGDETADELLEGVTLTYSYTFNGEPETGTLILAGEGVNNPTVFPSNVDVKITFELAEGDQLHTVTMPDPTITAITAGTHKLSLVDGQYQFNHSMREYTTDPSAILTYLNAKVNELEIAEDDFYNGETPWEVAGTWKLVEGNTDGTPRIYSMDVAAYGITIFANISKSETYGDLLGIVEDNAEVADPVWPSLIDKAHWTGKTTPTTSADVWYVADNERVSGFDTSDLDYTLDFSEAGFVSREDAMKANAVETFAIDGKKVTLTVTVVNSLTGESGEASFDFNLNDVIPQNEIDTVTVTPKATLAALELTEGDATSRVTTGHFDVSVIMKDGVAADSVTVSTSGLFTKDGDDYQAITSTLTTDGFYFGVKATADTLTAEDYTYSELIPVKAADPNAIGFKLDETATTGTVLKNGYVIGTTLAVMLDADAYTLTSGSSTITLTNAANDTITLTYDGTAFRGTVTGKEGTYKATASNVVLKDGGGGSSTIVAAYNTQMAEYLKVDDKAPVLVEVANLGTDMTLTISDAFITAENAIGTITYSTPVVSTPTATANDEGLVTVVWAESKDYAGTITVTDPAGNVAEETMAYAYAEAPIAAITVTPESTRTDAVSVTVEVSNYAKFKTGMSLEYVVLENAVDASAIPSMSYSGDVSGTATFSGFGKSQPITVETNDYLYIKVKATPSNAVDFVYGYANVEITNIVDQGPTIGDFDYALDEDGKKIGIESISGSGSFDFNVKAFAVGEGEDTVADENVFLRTVWYVVVDGAIYTEWKEGAGSNADAEDAYTKWFTNGESEEADGIVKLVTETSANGQVVSEGDFTAEVALTDGVAIVYAESTTDNSGFGEALTKSLAVSDKFAMVDNPSDITLKLSAEYTETDWVEEPVEFTANVAEPAGYDKALAILWTAVDNGTAKDKLPTLPPNYNNPGDGWNLIKKGTSALTSAKFGYDVEGHKDIYYIVVSGQGAYAGELKPLNYSGENAVTVKYDATNPDKVVETVQKQTKFDEVAYTVVSDDKGSGLESIWATTVDGTYEAPLSADETTVKAEKNDETGVYTLTLPLGETETEWNFIAFDNAKRVSEVTKVTVDKVATLVVDNILYGFTENPTAEYSEAITAGTAYPLYINADIVRSANGMGFGETPLAVTAAVTVHADDGGSPADEAIELEQEIAINYDDLADGAGETWAQTASFSLNFNELTVLNGEESESPFEDGGTYYIVITPSDGIGLEADEPAIVEFTYTNEELEIQSITFTPTRLGEVSPMQMRMARTAEPAAVDPTAPLRAGDKIGVSVIFNREVAENPVITIGGGEDVTLQKNEAYDGEEGVEYTGERVIGLTADGVLDVETKLLDENFAEMDEYLHPDGWDGDFWYYYDGIVYYDAPLSGFEGDLVSAVMDYEYIMFELKTVTDDWGFEAAHKGTTGYSVSGVTPEIVGGLTTMDESNTSNVYINAGDGDNKYNLGSGFLNEESLAFNFTTNVPVTQIIDGDIISGDMYADDNQNAIHSVFTFTAETEDDSYEYVVELDGTDNSLVATDDDGLVNVLTVDMEGLVEGLVNDDAEPKAFDFSEAATITLEVALESVTGVKNTTAIKMLEMEYLYEEGKVYVGTESKGVDTAENGVFGLGEADDETYTLTLSEGARTLYFTNLNKKNKTAFGEDASGGMMYHKRFADDNAITGLKSDSLPDDLAGWLPIAEDTVEGTGIRFTPEDATKVWVIYSVSGTGIVSRVIIKTAIVNADLVITSDPIENGIASDDVELMFEKDSEGDSANTDNGVEQFTILCSVANGAFETVIVDVKDLDFEDEDGGNTDKIMLGKTDTLPGTEIGSVTEIADGVFTVTITANGIYKVTAQNVTMGTSVSTVFELAKTAN